MIGLLLLFVLFVGAIIGSSVFNYHMYGKYPKINEEQMGFIIRNNLGEVLSAYDSPEGRVKFNSPESEALFIIRFGKIK